MKDASYFKVGKTYTKEYFGDNEAYKKQNGQTNFRITSIDGDKISCRDLFATYPDDVETLESNTWFCTLSSLLRSQVEYKYTQQEPKFIHSVKTTVKDAVESGIVKKEQIERIFRDQSGDYIIENPVSYHSSGIRSLQVAAESEENPYLQKAVFVWKSTEEMKKDVQSVFPEAWFMS